MSAADSKPTSASANVQGTHETVDALLADYLVAREAGTAPALTEFVAVHPEFRAQLEAFFSADVDLQRRVNAVLQDSEVVPPQRFGPYELLGELGRGGMGIVFKARHVQLNRTIALKMILRGQFASTIDVQRFQTEAEHAALLDHPNISPSTMWASNTGTTT